MDPERNSGGEPSQSGDDTAAVGVVVTPATSSPVAAETPARSVPEASSSTKKTTKSRRTRPKAGSHPNNVRKLRQSAMMSKAELARRAGVSPLTIDRVEAGCPCRMDTKRKILEALGLSPSAAKDVFPDLEVP